MTFPADGYHLSVGEGDSWWFLDVRYDVKIVAEQTGGALTLMEFAAPPGFGPPRHLHESEDEAFYVIDGAMRVVCGSKSRSGRVEPEASQGRARDIRGMILLDEPSPIAEKPGSNNDGARTTYGS